MKANKLDEFGMALKYLGEIDENAEHYRVVSRKLSNQIILWTSIFYALKLPSIAVFNPSSTNEKNPASSGAIGLEFDGTLSIAELWLNYAFVPTATFVFVPLVLTVLLGAANVNYQMRKSLSEIQ